MRTVCVKISPLCGVHGRLPLRRQRRAVRIDHDERRVAPAAFRVRAQHGKLPLELVRRPQIVRIEEGEQGRPGYRNGGIARGAGIAGMVQPKQANALVAREVLEIVERLPFEPSSAMINSHCGIVCLSTDSTVAGKNSKRLNVGMTIETMGSVIVRSRRSAGDSARAARQRRGVCDAQPTAGTEGTGPSGCDDGFAACQPSRAPALAAPPAAGSTRVYACDIVRVDAASGRALPFSRRGWPNR